MSSILKPYLERLLDHEALSEADAELVLGELTEPALAPAMAGALLAALRAKGVTADELRGFARGMRRLARRPELPDVGPTVDVVGTGGDASHSYNLSTGAALLAVAAGARIVKHGNRAATGVCGSADLLEALGYDLARASTDLAEDLKNRSFAFLFAPAYHPLLAAPNTLLLPHLGYSTEENYRAYYLGAVEAIEAYIKGTPIRQLQAY